MAAVRLPSGVTDPLDQSRAKRLSFPKLEYVVLVHFAGFFFFCIVQY
jgi:hypothetical protein